MAAPTDKMGVAAAIREIAATAPASDREMRSLAEHAAQLALHIQRNLRFGDVPEAVWHFLSDVDIRYKDPEYARLQNEEIEVVLRAWTGGESV